MGHISWLPFTLYHDIIAETMKIPSINLYFLSNWVIKMKLGPYGISFPHPKGAFCVRMTPQHYTVSEFLTPFLYEKDGVLLEGNAGDMLIMEPGKAVYHGPRRDAPGGFINDWIYVQGEDFAQLLDRYPLPLNTAFPIEKHLLLRGYLEQIQAEYRTTSVGAGEMMDSMATQMIIQIYRAYEKTQNRHPATRSVSIAADAILRNPGHNWRIQDLANLSGYSPCHFSVLYQEEYGISPMQDVLQKRIDLAKQYLLSGQASVSYVAEICGFQSVNYFSKFFKQLVGCPPSRYMQLVIQEKKQEDAL